MFDLVGNPIDRFSCDAAQCEERDVVAGSAFPIDSTGPVAWSALHASGQFDTYARHILSWIFVLGHSPTATDSRRTAAV